MNNPPMIVAHHRHHAGADGGHVGVLAERGQRQDDILFSSSLARFTWPPGREIAFMISARLSVFGRHGKIRISGTQASSSRQPTMRQLACSNKYWLRKVRVAIRFDLDRMQKSFVRQQLIYEKASDASVFKGGSPWPALQTIFRVLQT
jgi:hypothetical protein